METTKVRVGQTYIKEATTKSGSFFGPMISTNDNGLPELDISSNSLVGGLISKWPLISNMKKPTGAKLLDPTPQVSCENVRQVKL